jgi:predicted DCC family thiol-disulfide oxidoreductase YuxK
MPADKPGLTVFHDGACPLCRREIGWYRRRRNDGRIDWLDISHCEDDALPEGFDRPTLLARFHVALADGRIVSGPPAFAALWERYPGLRWLARLTRVPPMPLLMEAGYRVFLRLRPRLQRLAGCRETCD